MTRADPHGSGRSDDTGEETDGGVRPVRQALKNGALAALTLPGLRRICRRLLRDQAIIFMLHRFADSAHGVRGHDPGHVEACLEWLKRNDHPVMGLRELVSRWGEGRNVPSGTVCFTVDDGYYDFSTVGLELFEKFGYPVTVFLPSKFIDGRIWLWWDKIEFILRETDASSLGADELGRFLGPGRTIDLTTPEDRAAAVSIIVSELHHVSDDTRLQAIRRLAREANVHVPAEPPRRYSAMDWSDVRAAEEGVAQFAPHTHTHPVLSTTSRERSKREIETSWRRLRAETRAPVPVFAYPEGSPWAFGEREERLAEEAGLSAAVSSRGGYLLTGRNIDRDTMRWKLPRFGFPNRRSDFMEVCTGVLRLRDSITRSLSS